MNPADQCEFFNAAFAGARTCECARYDRRDTNVTCTYNEPQCTADMTSCYDGSIEMIQDLNGDSHRVTTCTNVTSTLLNRLQHTCVTVNAVKGTSMAKLESCTATLNGKACNYCHVCGDQNVTIDCCNVMQDMRQEECMATQNGSFIPTFPNLAEDDAGQCKGSYGYSSAPVVQLPLMAWWVALAGTLAVILFG